MLFYIYSYVLDLIDIGRFGNVILYVWEISWELYNSNKDKIRKKMLLVFRLFSFIIIDILWELGSLFWVLYEKLKKAKGWGLNK